MEFYGFYSYIFSEYDAIQSNIYKNKKVENGGREECKFIKSNGFKLSFSEISLCHLH
jgi:hypothetical protein